jgi:iron complex transport system ATP-binding protein
VEQALRDVDAEEFADRSFNVLSGGERARILLARALCLRAPLLLGDEPIAALDPYHQLQVMRLLRDTARAGIGVLVVMHDLTLASRFMDRLILMHEGRIVASGPPATVLSTRNMADVYRVTAVMADEQGHRVVIPWENQPGDRRP